LDDPKRQQKDRHAAQPKSLIYGMKDKEASTKPVNPMQPSRPMAAAATEPQTAGPVLAKATAVVVASSPRKNIPAGGFGRTRRAVVTVQSHTRKVQSM